MQTGKQPGQEENRMQADKSSSMHDEEKTGTR